MRGCGVGYSFSSLHSFSQFGTKRSLLTRYYNSCTNLDAVTNITNYYYYYYYYGGKHYFTNIVCLILFSKFLSKNGRKVRLYEN
jgi:hypothetical protein